MSRIKRIQLSEKQIEKMVREIEECRLSFVLFPVGCIPGLVEGKGSPGVGFRLCNEIKVPESGVAPVPAPAPAAASLWCCKSE